MEKIKEIKVSLLEKEENFNIDESNKGNYIARASESIFPELFLEKKKIVLNDIEYKNFAEDITNQMFEDLSNKTKEQKIDSVGIWFTFENEKIIENSIDLTILNSMAEHHNDIEPIKEFVKMTLIDA